MKICFRCPLYLVKQGIPICNPSLYLNVETKDVSLKSKEGYIKGCGCDLNKKTADPNKACPTNQW